MLKRLSTFLVVATGFVSSQLWAAAPIVNPLIEQYVEPGETLSVRISGWDPDGGVPGLYIQNMPADASFDDNGDGTRTFTWTPERDDIGYSTFTVVATDAQADGSSGSSELYVLVDDFEFIVDYLEPEILDVTNYELTGILPGGNYFLDSISFDTVYHVSVVENIDTGFDYNEDYIFGIGSRLLPIYSDYGTRSYYNYYGEIGSSNPYPWGTQSRIAADDQRVVVLDSAYQPAAVYENAAGVWIEEAKLEATSSTGSAQRYTSNLAIDGQTIVTGHSADDVFDGNRLVGSGAVRVYDYDSSQWSYTTTIKAPNPDEHDQFGSALDIDGDILVISAIGEASAGSGSDADMFNNDYTSSNPYWANAETSGAVYVYERLLGTWVNTAYLKASDNTSALRFGWDVAVDGDRIYVGAPARNIDTSADYLDYFGNSVDDTEGAVYVFEKNSAGDWSETHLIESANTETKFGLYLSAKNDALAIGSAVGTTLLAYQGDQWNSLWHARIAPYSVALGTETLAIATSEGIKALFVDDFYFADEDDIGLDAPTFYGEHFNNGVYSKSIQAGEEVAIVISARQIDGVPGLFLENDELGATLEDNGDGTRTFRWRATANDGGVFSFEVVASNAFDSSVRSAAAIEISVAD